MNTNVVKSPNNNKKVPILSLDGRDTSEQHDRYFIPQIKQLKRVHLEGGGDDLGGQVEVGGEVLNAVVGEEPVVVHPTECLPHITLLFEALHHLSHAGSGHRCWGAWTGCSLSSHIILFYKPTPTY